MKQSRALLLIDIQNDYFPGGKMELSGSDEAAFKAAAVVRSFRDKQLPVIHIAHESVREGAAFFLPGTAGQRIHDAVQPRQGERVITKNFPNSFFQTPLLATLQGQGITQLYIAGMMTHMCVDATTRAAKDLGFTCTLIHDATATKDLSFAGKQVRAAQVQTAFTAALAYICDAVLDTGEAVRTMIET